MRSQPPLCFSDGIRELVVGRGFPKKGQDQVGSVAEAVARQPC